MLGNEKDLLGKAEVGSLFANLLKAGTKTRTKEQIQDLLDQTKSNLYFNSYGQNLYLSFSTYNEHFPKIMELIKDILNNATFPQNELVKSVTETNTWLEGQIKDPQAIAQNELQRLANPYPKTSIFYTPSLQEQIDDYKKVTREQVVDFYKNIFGTSNGYGTIIGSLDKNVAAKSLENVFGKLVAKSKFVEAMPTYFETQKADKKIITPDKENAVALGTLSLKMKQDHPDYAALTMANEILGSGGFLTARIPTRLRKKEGISYGAGSFIDVPLNNDVASWGYYAILNPTKRDAVENALKEEVAKALKDGFTQEELDANKKSFSNQRTTMLGMENTLVNLVNTKLQYGISLDNFDDVNTKIQALKLDEVNAALRKYISLDKLTSVYAGDFNKK